MTSSNYFPTQGKRVSRDQFLTILHTAQGLEEDRFARNAALTWLASYPGDLPVNLSYAQTLLKVGRVEQVLPVLQRICTADPEYLPAVELLLQAESQLAKENAKPRGLNKGRNKNRPSNEYQTMGWMLALGGDPESVRGEVTNKNFSEVKTVVAWSQILAKVRVQIQDGNIQGAEGYLHKLLAQEPTNPLIAVTHLMLVKDQVASQQTSPETLLSLADYYHQRWPECIHFTLLLADTLMSGGEADEAVGLIHQAAAKDITGQVARRLWGENHPYRRLWPEHLETLLDIPIPAAVAATLGWNKLPQGEPLSAAGYAAARDISALNGLDSSDVQVAQLDDTRKSTLRYSEPEELRSVREELERIGARIKKPALAKADGRFPVYVIMTTRQGLEKRYGLESLGAIEAEMLRLVATIARRKNWEALLFYADQGVCIREQPLQLESQPVRYNDPWGLKLALVDLDLALARNGERIGAVLIVGGPSVLPFHHLPNPVDDDDDDVPSDNPYGTLDENYFIPEWPVGRLPDDGREGNANPDPLLKAIRTLTQRQAASLKQGTTKPWIRRMLSSVLRWLQGRTHIPFLLKSSFGYTAAIWRQASLSVFRPIGDPRALRVSPPAGVRQSGTNLREGAPLPAAKLGYFNLHGLVDTVEWYGQRDPSDNGAGSPGGEEADYPIAVQPEDITNSGRAPQIVFTEACYGNHILGRVVEESLALKFIQSGTQAVVGSTSTAYGAISTPLIAADFLGHTFWNYIKNGFPTGEALRLAKIALAQEMHQRQGYLDGEDQKTLISFVLYGDPLVYLAAADKKPKAVMRTTKPALAVKTICDRHHEAQESEPIPEDVLSFVKSVVEQYLPGMHDANMMMSQEHIICDAQGCRPVYPNQAYQAQLKPGLTTSSRPMRKVITLSKRVPSAHHLHRHYARLTLDDRGKLVKLVVSR